jgi:hypothetical protein
MTVGEDVGRKDGKTLGIEDSYREGVLLGELDWYGEGFGDGATIGKEDGDSVGHDEGT